MTRLPLVCALCLLTIVAAAAQDQLDQSDQAPQPPQPLTVAVLDFEIDDPTQPELGQQVAQVLAALLSGEPGITLVDRGTLTRTLEEQELNLTGLVQPDQAVRIGQLAGARLLVTGKAFPMGDRTFLTCKIIGTETSLVDGLLIKGKPADGIDDLVVQLGEQLPQRVREAGPKLVAQTPAADPLGQLKEQLRGRDLPVVAVVVFEEHHAQQTPRQPVDPAVETELKQMLLEAGFEVQDVDQNELADWARQAGAGQVQAWPRGLHGVDVVITGEAFSEYATSIGNLVSATGRAEINLVDRERGRIVLAGRETTRAVDLSEQIAGKKALQKAGRQLGLQVLEHFAQPTQDENQDGVEQDEAI